MVDAWDVIIQDTPSNIARAFHTMDVEVLLGYELACNRNSDTCPNPEDQEAIHDGHFLCSGVLLGKARDILNVIETNGIPHENDQKTWALWYTANYPSIDLDMDQKIIANLGGGEHYISVNDGLVLTNGKAPMVAHFNGQKPKRIMKNITQSNLSFLKVT